MDTGKKIVVRKQGLKTLDKCSEISTALKDMTANNISEIDLSHNSIS